MSFPSTLEGLRENGYKFSGDATCKKCGAAIEWWETPRGKKMPTDHGTANPHWSTCPNADEFRGNNNNQPSSKITTATLNMEWLKQQAASCHCVVCKKLTRR